MDELNEIGANSLDLGVALHKAVGGLVTKSPNEVTQIQELAEFFNEHPDAVEVLGRITRSNQNPNIKQLDHLTSYMLLSKKKLGILDSLDNINNELKYYG